VGSVPCSDEWELGILIKKLHRTRTDFVKALALERLGGLPTSPEVLQLLEPHLSLYSTKKELGSTIGS
jgi:hypothetical protein